MTDRQLFAGATRLLSMKLTLLRGVLAAALGSAALLVPGSPADAAPAPVAPTTTVAATVTPGSYLAVVEQGPDAKDFGGIIARSQSLVLVSPTGQTQTLYTRRVRHYNGFSLMDWSADGATALLAMQRHGDAKLVGLDLATGATRVLKVPHFLSAVLDPAGTGAIVTAFKGPRSDEQVLETVSWSGVVTLLRSGINGTVMAGHDGTVLTSDRDHARVQLLVSTSTGAVLNRFRGQGYCAPVRWWDATRVLETCGNRYDLYLVDPTTGHADQLTDDHGRGDGGHLDARYAGQNLYVQVAGACGYTYVAKVTRHSTRHLDVPGAVGNVVMVNAVGYDLVIEHAASCDGDRPRSVLSLFDPVSHDETPLLRLGRHQDFGRILLLGEVRVSSY